MTDTASAPKPAIEMYHTEFVNSMNCIHASKVGYQNYKGFPGAQNSYKTQKIMESSQMVNGRENEGTLGSILFCPFGRISDGLCEGVSTAHVLNKRTV